MRATPRRVALACVALAATACSQAQRAASDGEMPSALTPEYGNIITPKGDITFGHPIAHVAIKPGQLHGFTFDALAGGVVHVADTPDDGALPTTIYLFGPPDAYGTRYEVTHALGSTALGAVIDRATLPVDGQYELVAGVRGSRSGNYTLALACVNGKCTAAPPTPPGPTSFADTRILQKDIDAGRYTAAQLFAIGDFLFNHRFTIGEGLGNALTGLPAGGKPRPNLRRIQFDLFGGPDGDACASCHSVGGDDGGGTLPSDPLVEGDGDTESSALERNGLALLGDGYVQQLGIEMTAELQGEIAAAKKQAAATGHFVTAMLTSKGISFGSAVARPNGVVDSSNVAGVDVDLVVRPFGWKGTTAALRRFIEGALQAHHGMQAETLIAVNCATPIPERVGNGADCHDPDADGVKDEILEGQLTALAIYAATVQTPVQNLPTDATAKARVAYGAQLFTKIGCATCHQPQLTLDDWHHAEAPDLTGGAPFVIDLTVDGEAPRLAVSGGKVTVPLYSDLKRHDMGAALADAHDTRGVSPAGAAIAPRMFLTRPLWGVAASAPYLHDGRAPELRDAILGHDGEAATARAAFAALAADEAAQLVEFLGTLGRAPAAAGN
jgi:mono/diheme cytochrome c family protein